MMSLLFEAANTKVVRVTERFLLENTLSRHSGSGQIECLEFEEFVSLEGWPSG